jgi:hypothetical protein
LVVLSLCPSRPLTFSSIPCVLHRRPDKRTVPVSIWKTTDERYTCRNMHAGGIVDSADPPPSSLGTCWSRDLEGSKRGLSLDSFHAKLPSGSLANGYIVIW